MVAAKAEADQQLADSIRILTAAQQVVPTSPVPPTRQPLHRPGLASHHLADSRAGAAPCHPRVPTGAAVTATGATVEAALGGGIQQAHRQVFGTSGTGTDTASRGGAAAAGHGVAGAAPLPPPDAGRGSARPSSGHIVPPNQGRQPQQQQMHHEQQHRQHQPAQTQQYQQQSVSQHVEQQHHQPQHQPQHQHQLQQQQQQGAVSPHSLLVSAAAHMHLSPRNSLQIGHASAFDTSVSTARQLWDVDESLAAGRSPSYSSAPAMGPGATVVRSSGLSRTRSGSSSLLHAMAVHFAPLTGATLQGMPLPVRKVPSCPSARYGPACPQGPTCKVVPARYRPARYRPVRKDWSCPSARYCPVSLQVPACKVQCCEALLVLAHVTAAEGQSALYIWDFPPALFPGDTCERATS